MKRIFITGASSGIGQATTRALLGQGDEVWGTSRNPSGLAAADQRFHPIQLDLHHTAAIEETFARALSEAGHFDVVINNAGSGHFGPAELLSRDEIAEQFQIVFFSHVRLMQLALTAMRQRGSGRIINVTSLAALLPVPFMGAYNAAKSAMASFTMSLQVELGDGNVRVIDLQPADIRTKFNDTIQWKADSSYEDRVAKTWAAVDKNMKGAPGPEVVARAIMRLIEDANPPRQAIVGDLFQAKIAPFLYRFLPQRTRVWGLKKYYGL
jgi:NAD(P)-dependent dehydrogenase (short-subunit alcohol dehydrogenase family)